MSRRILCIEDDADTCELLATWLGLHNCLVTSASTMARDNVEPTKPQAPVSNTLIACCVRESVHGRALQP